MGSGEFEPWTREPERFALGRTSKPRGGGILIVPTASAADGEETFRGWTRKGLDHYASMGIPSSVLPVRTRDDAFRPEFVEAVAPAAMIFFSGGNPAYLADTLRETPVWQAICRAVDEGAVYAGCSAGACVCGEAAPTSVSDEKVWTEGLRLIPGTLIAPHWDRLNGHRPEQRESWIEQTPEEWRLLTVDERTAIVGDGREWRVFGSGRALVGRGDLRSAYEAGDRFTIPWTGALEAGRREAARRKRSRVALARAAGLSRVSGGSLPA